jgi:metal-responsive CopG/Arc/MetJ family transcriptional regulator
MKKTIALRLSEKLRKELDAVVSEEHSSRSRLIREAIERYLAVKRFRKLRMKTLPFAAAQGLLTDRDVFKAMASGDNRG